MKNKRLLAILFLVGMTNILTAQSFVRTSDLFQKDDANDNTGRLQIHQPAELDSLIHRHILANQNLSRVNNHLGMEGFRIQIFSSNNRNAREESNRINAAFISRYPNIASHQLYAEPAYFRIRVGDFRTRTEAVKLLQMLRREYPSAYIVPDIIRFPELNNR